MRNVVAACVTFDVTRTEKTYMVASQDLLRLIQRALNKTQEVLAHWQTTYAHTRSMRPACHTATCACACLPGCVDHHVHARARQRAGSNGCVCRRPPRAVRSLPVCKPE